MPAALLNELLCVLTPQAHEEPMDQFFTRQVHKRVLGEQLWEPRDGWVRIRLVDNVVKVSEEHWSIEELAKLGKWHDRKSPVQISLQAPVVIFRGWGEQWLIDGQNRVNLWCSEGKPGTHRALVAKLRNERPDPFPGRPQMPRAGVCGVCGGN